MQSAQGAVASVSCNGVYSFTKPVRDEIVLVTGLGVEGDSHAGIHVRHRSRVRADPRQPNLRQVHLIHEELFAEVAGKGYEVRPGNLGENVTTRGIDLLGLPVGTILRFGPAGDGGDRAPGDRADGDWARDDRADGGWAGADRVGGDPAGGDPAGGDPAGGDPAGGDPAGGDAGALGGSRAGGERAGGDRAGGERAGGRWAGGWADGERAGGWAGGERAGRGGGGASGGDVGALSGALDGVLAAAEGATLSEATARAAEAVRAALAREVAAEDAAAGEGRGGDRRPALVVAGLRNPCRQIDGFRPGLLKEVVGRGEDGRLVRKGGIMTVVLRGGVVRPGDAITVELPPLPHADLEPV
ncbi:MOSC domain-containing protein [Actinoplanes sp. URMC 104]|uniref:MOSC domain-containing protein n=1 Tax=Actinoplanes sp. URMC 104 TaxID=3423409 RepID=UPI003F1C029A